MTWAEQPTCLMTLMLSWMRLRITQIRVITWTTPQPGTTLRKTFHNLQRIGWTSRVGHLGALAEEAHLLADRLAPAEEAVEVLRRLIVSNLLGSMVRVVLPVVEAL